MKASVGKIALASAVAIAVVGFFAFGLHDYLTLETLKSKQAELQTKFDDSPLSFSLLFALFYIGATALSVPGATVMTLAAGFVFGFWPALALVSISSTIGATLAFLTSRFLLMSFVESHFSDRVKQINSGVESEGPLYLLTLRLVPAFPFFLVNLGMGLTKIPTLTFSIVSLVGMLPGTAAYVNAGTQLSDIDSMKSALSPSLIASFVIIGVLPLLAKKIIGHFKRKKSDSAV